MVYLNSGSLDRNNTGKTSWVNLKSFIQVMKSVNRNSMNGKIYSCKQKKGGWETKIATKSVEAMIVRKNVYANSHNTYYVSCFWYCLLKYCKLIIFIFITINMQY